MNEKRIAFWSNHIKAWKSDNISQTQYCKQNNLNDNLFSKWKIRLSNTKTEKSNSFVEIKQVLPEQFKSNDNIEIIIKDIYKIKLTHNFNKDILKNLLSIFGDEK